MNISTQYENLSSADRVLRFVVGIVAIVVAMESSLAGTPALAAISVLAIGLSTTAILGWDPLKSVALKMKSAFSGTGIGQTEKHA